MKSRRQAVAVSAVLLSLLYQGLGSCQAVSAEVSVRQQSVLRVSLDVLNGFSGADTAKIKQAADIVERVLNSEQFHQAVVNFTYEGEPQFVQNNGLSNEQIYQTLMAGRETYNGVDDHVANLDLNLYTPPFYKKWSVVGYGYPGQPEIFMNWYYFDSFSIAEVAGNVAHEWCHKLGFDHDYKRTARRPYSVPYGIGGLVQQLGAARSVQQQSVTLLQ
jgi:hypothetical protein